MEAGQTLFNVLCMLILVIGVYYEFIINSYKNKYWHLMTFICDRALIRNVLQIFLQSFIFLSFWKMRMNSCSTFYFTTTTSVEVNSIGCPMLGQDLLPTCSPLFSLSLVFIVNSLPMVTWKHVGTNNLYPHKAQCWCFYNTTVFSDYYEI